MSNPSAQYRSGAALPWGSLPTKLRLLHIADARRTGGWLAEALAADGGCRTALVEVAGAAAGAARLREEPFDAVLVSHRLPELDAFELVAGLRAGGSDEPLVVLGDLPEVDQTALAYEVGADGYLSVHSTTTRTLLWLLGRACERHALLNENARLAQAHRHRLQREQHEADRLLAQQRALIDDLEQMRGPVASADLAADASPPATAETALGHFSASAGCASDRPSTAAMPCLEHYRELLRAYVIMGSGNLAGEMRHLAQTLAGAEATAPQALELHLHALEELLRGLGSRSARHVMSRADLLILEVMVHLAEVYRTRGSERPVLAAPHEAGANALRPKHAA